MTRLKPICLIVICFALSACATKIAPTAKFNPAPEAPFSAYQSFELQSLEIPSDIAAREPRVSDQLKYEVHARLSPMLDSWNSNPISRTSGNSSTLVFKPKIEELKFISTGERLLAGAFAGSSAIILRLEIVEAESGRVIANPEFYQHANAWGSAHSYGSTDRAMLGRVVDLMAEYVTENYRVAQGGATGQP